MSETENTSVESSKKSSVSQSESGTLSPHSELGAALQVTQTGKIPFGDSELDLNVETIQVLICLLNGYMTQVYSGDLTILSFYAAKDFSKKLGIPEDRFAEIANVIHKELEKKRKNHLFVRGGFMS